MLSGSLHKQIIATCQREPTVTDSYGVHFVYEDLCARLIALKGQTDHSPRMNVRNKNEQKVIKVPNLIGLEFLTGVPNEVKSERARHMFDGNLFQTQNIKMPKTKLLIRNSSGSIKNLSQLYMNGSSTERIRNLDRIKTVYGNQKLLTTKKKTLNIDLGTLKLNRVASVPEKVGINMRKSSLLRKVKTKAHIIKRN